MKLIRDIKENKFFYIYEKDFHINYWLNEYGIYVCLHNSELNSYYYEISEA